jgi:hypothetical protein
MGRGIARITDCKFPGRPRDHLEHTVGYVFLHAQEAQCGAALAGRTKRRHEHVIGHLFRQRSGIDDHCVYTASFGDQRRDRAIFPCQRLVDRARNLRRPGEGNTRNAAICGKHCSDFPVAQHQLKRARRHTTRVEKLYRLERDKWRLLGGFGDNAIAGRQRPRDLTGKYRQRKIPRADANENAAPAHP